MVKKYSIVDYVWFLYFFIMLNFYTLTYVQLFSQIFVILFSIVDLLKRKAIKKDTFVSIRSFFLWYGIFVIWAFLSKFWCVYPPRSDANTILALIRIAIMSTFLCFYISNLNDKKILLKSFIYNVLLFSIIILFTNPISSWGTTDFYSFNHGYHRNTIAYYCLLSICLLDYLKEGINKKNTIFCSLFLFFIMIICGSRGSIILLIIYKSLNYIMDKKLNIKLLKIIVILILLSFVLLISYYVPMLRNLYFDRILQIFAGLESSDMSVVGRMSYISIGFDMFMKKPFIGWGVDGFYNYLLHSDIIIRGGKLKAVYSHNNYIELLSCFGIIGFFIYYNIYVKILRSHFSKRNISKKSRYIILLIIIFIIGDFRGINFSYHISIYILTSTLYFNNYLKEESYDVCKKISKQNSK